MHFLCHQTDLCVYLRICFAPDIELIVPEMKAPVLLQAACVIVWQYIFSHTNDFICVYYDTSQSVCLCQTSLATPLSS